MNDAGLAAFFNITPSAVSQWGDDEPLPTPRQWELMARKPEIFSTKAQS